MVCQGLQAIFDRLQVSHMHSRLGFLTKPWIFSRTLWIGFILVFALCNCTGINVWSSNYKASGTTHPTPDYANPMVILRGGGVLHQNTVAGSLGKEQPGDLYRGEACSWSILWLVAGGDSSLSAAKDQAKIQYIHFTEFKQEAVFIFFLHNFCTVVVGSKEESINQERTKSVEDLRP